MTPNDILGIGKVLPIDKLLDIVVKAFGRLSKPYFDKKDIDTRAYEIKKIAEARSEEMKIISSAVKENFKITGGIKYQEGMVKISSPKGIPNSVDPKSIIAPSIEQRMQERLTFQQTKKQINLENITCFAAGELKDEEPIIDESIDEDWITRFFGIAEDISSEEMQTLWGKILAGEIKRPRSFSLRTLELIRNLTKEEANLFNKIANYAILVGDENFIFKPKMDILNNNYNISYGEIVQLYEIGLIQPGEFATYLIKEEPNDSKSTFLSGNYVIIVDKKAHAPKIEIPIYLFTHSANQLLTLISSNPSLEYLKLFAQSIVRESIKVQYGLLIKKTGTHIEFQTPLQEFPKI